MTASSPVDHAIVTIRGKLGFMRLMRTRSVPVPHHPWIPVVPARPKDSASKNISHGGAGVSAFRRSAPRKHVSIGCRRVYSLSGFEPELSPRKVSLSTSLGPP